MDNGFYNSCRHSLSVAHLARPKLSGNRIRALFALIFAAAASATAWSTTLDEIGYTALQTQLGAATPDGSGVSVSQIEAKDANGNFVPDANFSEFSGKTIDVISTTTGNSSHARIVGTQFFGNTSSAASGITDIHVYEANAFMSGDLLRLNSSNPRVETQDIQNHSWITNSAGNASTDERLLERLDFVINRDDVTVVAALNNGSSNPVPAIWANSFNSIIVGMTNGNHSAGQTSIQSSMRQVPHIVAPNTATSYATPLVSASAAVLLEAARADTNLNAADRNEVIRSLLLTGATKDEISGWSNSSTEPLDARYGAGELNVHRSYNTLAAGQQAPGTMAAVDAIGWDLQTSATGTQTYFFDIPTGVIVDEFSTVLTWNRNVTDIVPGAGFSGQHELNDLDLRLYSANGFTLDTMLAESVSDDNTEHIYFSDTIGPSNPLTAGRFALVVDAGNNPQDYALSWFSEQVAVPPCDFDIDGDCDPADLDMLYANFGGSLDFDADGSGVVDGADISVWLSQASDVTNPFNVNGLTFVLGDLNFDGSVDAVDLGLLLNNFTDTSGLLYEAGNLNDDPDVDSADLGLLLNNFGFSSASFVAATAAAVPEPVTNGWVILFVAAITLRRRQ